MPTSSRLRRRASRSLTSLATFSIFGLPTFAIFIVVVSIPVVWTLLIGLTNERATRPDTSFIGLDNVFFLLTNAEFLHSLANTVTIAVIVVVVTNVLGLGIALLVSKQGWFYNFARSIFFTPVILSGVVVSVIWRAILLDAGLLNSVLASLGVKDPPRWLSDPDYAIYSVSLIIVWQLLGFAVVIYVAGLAGVPTDIEEAASLDGAGPVKRFRFVTWPLLAPSVTIITVMLMISSFKVYDHIVVLTNGGPGTNGTATIAFRIIQTAFSEQRAGLASAMAGIMLAIVGVASAVVLRLLQRREVNL